MCTPNTIVTNYKQQPKKVINSNTRRHGLDVTGTKLNLSRSLAVS